MAKTNQQVLEESTKVAQEAARAAGLNFSPGAEVKNGQIVVTDTGKQALSNPLLTQFSSPSSVATSDSVRNAETQSLLDQQKQDQTTQTEIERLTRKKQLQDLKATLAPDNEPTKPDLVGTFDALRQSQGVTDVETELADIRANKLKLKNEYNEFVSGVNGQGRTQGDVNSATSEQARKINIELDRLNVAETLATERLNSKNKYIETVMNLTEKDYSNAVQDYNTEFAKNLQIQTQLNTQDDREDAEQNRLRDDARAYLSTVSNFLTTSGKTLNEVDPTMKAEINKRELQAGFPAGTLETFLKVKPKANLIATKDGVDASGQAVVSLIYSDENGNPGIVKTIPLKGVYTKTQSDSNGESADTKSTKRLSQVAPAVDSLKGNDGYLNPQAYKDLYNTYVRENPGKGKEFLDNYPVNIYINPRERTLFKT
jgi:hypothetical protein